MREKRESIMDIDCNNLLIILSDYFSKKLNRTVKVNCDVKVKYVSYGMYDDTEAVPDIEFFIKEVSNNGKVVTTTTTYLDQSDLEEAVSDYVTSLGYEYDSFKYVGGVRLAGYFRDEYEEAHFEGLEVKLKEKSMQRVLK